MKNLFLILLYLITTISISQNQVDASVQTVPRALIVVPSETLFGPCNFSRKESLIQDPVPVPKIKERPKSSFGVQTVKINPRNSAQSMSKIIKYSEYDD